MDYVIFDLEWNQCPYGKGKENGRQYFHLIESGTLFLNSGRHRINPLMAASAAVVMAAASSKLTTFFFIIVFSFQEVQRFCVYGYIII